MKLLLIIGLISSFPAINSMIPQPDIIEDLSDTHTANQNRLLLKAATEGDLEAVQRCIKGQAEIEACDEQRETALYKAAKNGHLAVVHYLLSEEANIEAESLEGISVVAASEDKGHTEIVELLKKQKDFNAQLLQATRDGNTEQVKLLLEQGAHLETFIQSDDETDGMPPLFLAAYYGYLDIVALLLSSSKKSLDGKSRIIDGGKTLHTATPLYWAAKKGHLAIVELLLQNGAYTEIDGDAGPLHASVKKRYSTIVARLLEYGANPGAFDCYGETPLSIAVKKDFTEAIKLMLACYKEKLKNDRLGVLPFHTNDIVNHALHAAAIHNKVDAARILVENNANCMKRDDYDISPFIIAGLSNHLELCKLFLRTLRVISPSKREILLLARKKISTVLLCFKAMNSERAAQELPTIPLELQHTILLSLPKDRTYAAFVLLDLLLNKDTILATGAHFARGLYTDKRCLMQAAWVLFSYHSEIERASKEIIGKLAPEETDTKTFLTPLNRSETVISEIAKGLLERISQ